MSSKNAKIVLCRGTVANVAGALAVRVNGEVKALTQPELSILMRLAPSIAKRVGTIRSAGKGRPATVYDWGQSALIKLEIDPAATVAEVDEAQLVALGTKTGVGEIVADA